LGLVASLPSHPASQAKLEGTLVKLAKERSLQLIIMTRSEHVLLKFLNLVVKGVISHRELKVYYFERDEEKPRAHIEELKVTEKGRLVDGLKGFIEHEVAELEEYIKAESGDR